LIIVTLTGIIYRSTVRRIESIEEETDENSQFRLRNND